ncbi:hypothetical protein [Collimonas fungivorans]|uniref:hypothetical protein n=1 Tax=Collimonas fungivorans TaxID=158899 RepID=UPI0026F171FD|nr:hypothetical protein [Collimonas fungivorans]
MRTACAGAAMDFQAGVAAGGLALAGRRMAWPENYPGLNLAFLQMQRPASAGKNTQYISQHHHWLRLVQQYIHPVVSREVRQEVLHDVRRQIESRFEKHYMQRLQQVLQLAVPANRPGDGSRPAPTAKTGPQGPGQHRSVLQMMRQNQACDFRSAQDDAMPDQADGIVAHPLTLLMQRMPATQARQSTPRRNNEAGSRAFMITLAARLAGFVRQTLPPTPGQLRQSATHRHSAPQFAKQAAPASLSSRPLQAGHPVSRFLQLKFDTQAAQRTTSGMHLNQRYFHYLDRRDIDRKPEQHFHMREKTALRRQETVHRRDVQVLQLASRSGSHDFRTAGSRPAWRSRVQRVTGNSGGVSRMHAYVYKSMLPSLPAAGAETGSKRLQHLTTPSLPPSPTVVAALPPMNILAAAGSASGDQVSLRHYQAGFTTALAYRQQPQARQAEVQRQMERIEHTVHTKVVREIMHSNHNQQHIRSVVTAAMLSPQMVQALARQVHASIEQRAGIERYRRGR